MSIFSGKTICMYHVGYLVFLYFKNFEYTIPMDHLFNDALSVVSALNLNKDLTEELESKRTWIGAAVVCFKIITQRSL